jgi:hypothetical protein
MTRLVRLVAFGWALATVNACSASNPPTAGGQTTMKPTPGTTAGDDGGEERRESGAAADASSAKMRAEGGVVAPVTCDAIAAEGKIVEELSVAGDMPPPLGGKVAAGTYVLFELYDYPGDADAGGTTGLAARKSLVLGSTTYRLADAEGRDDAGLGSSTVTGGTYAVSVTTLTRMQECPNASTIKNGYSAAGGQLGLYDGTHFEVYELETPP